MKFSVVVIAKNLANLDHILSFTNLTDDLVIVVDEATDIKNFPKLNIFHRPLAANFANKRNFALSKCQNDWVFMIDDDETVDHELLTNLFQLAPSSDIAGYAIKRKDYYYDERLEYGETGFISLVRLVNRKRGTFVRPVHEYFKTKGKIAKLGGEIIHQHSDLTSSFLDRIILYGPIDSLAFRKENKRFNYLSVFTKPIGKFVVNYFFKFGLIDGTIGLFHAYLMSVQSLSVRVFQWSIS